MKPSRQFRPPAPVALEDRIAPSQIAGGGHHPAPGRPHPPAQVQGAGAASNAAFDKNIADTIAAGLPVNELRTTRYGDGSTQTETRLIEPNTINSSSLTTATVTLRHNGGTERVTDFSYVSASGNTVRVVTTVLPDGSVRSENQTLQPQGDTTLINGVVKLPGNAGVEGISGSRVVRGPVTTTDETITEPDGTVKHDHIVTVHRGELRETETTTETQGKGRPQVTRTTTTIVRLPPPTPVALGAPAPGAVATTPRIS